MTKTCEQRVPVPYGRARIVMDQCDANQLAHFVKLWAPFAGRMAIRALSKASASRFAKPYLWPGKRRFQA